MIRDINFSVKYVPFWKRLLGKVFSQGVFYFIAFIVIAVWKLPFPYWIIVVVMFLLYVLNLVRESVKQISAISFTEENMTITYFRFDAGPLTEEFSLKENPKLSIYIPVKGVWTSLHLNIKSPSKKFTQYKTGGWTKDVIHKFYDDYSPMLGNLRKGQIG